MSTHSTIRPIETGTGAQAPAVVSARRVLLLVPDMSSETGGIARVNHSVLRLLAHLRDEGRIEIALRALKPLMRIEEDETIRRLAGEDLKYHRGSHFAFALDAWFKSVTWADLVISTHVGLSAIAATIPEARRPKWLTFIHGLDVWLPLSRMKRAGLLASTHIVSNSHFTGEHCRKFNPWLPPVVDCPLGVTAAEPATSALELERSLGFLPGPHDILIVGRMEKGEGLKGHEVLFDSLSLVRKEIGDARLIVVGTGNATDDYLARARRLPAFDAIRFVGYLSKTELAAMYRLAGVFAMPSRQEGFGLVYAEAMREGLPCIVSDQDAGQEVIEDGRTGFVVPAGDVQAVSKAIIRILKDPSLRQQMAMRSQRRFQERFTEERFHSRFLELLRSVGGL